MSELNAAMTALQLFHVPSGARVARSAPLPEGLPFILKMAASDSDALMRAAALTGRSPETLRQASGFFIEQVLLCSNAADSYRILGARPDAPQELLRRNMALLLRFLHPDVDPEGSRALLAGRVTRAWETVKTPERRAAYDAIRDRAHPRTGYKVRSRPASSGPRRASRPERPFDGVLRRLADMFLFRPAR